MSKSHLLDSHNHMLHYQLSKTPLIMQKDSLIEFFVFPQPVFAKFEDTF